MYTQKNIQKKLKFAIVQATVLMKFVEIRK